MESLWYWLKHAPTQRQASPSPTPTGSRDHLATTTTSSTHDGLAAIDPENPPVSYEDYGKVVERFLADHGGPDTPAARAKVDLFLRASTFVRLPKDSRGRVSALSLFDLTMRKSVVLSMQVDLFRYDADGDGRLTLAELRSYLADTVALLPPLAPLCGVKPGGQMMEDMSAFLPTWLDMAVQKFAFHHARRGYVNIHDLTLPQGSIQVLDELHRLRDLTGTDEASMRRLVENWFSVEKSTWLHSIFRDLDEDGDGLIRASEFERFPLFQLSPLFVERLFQEHASGRVAVVVSREDQDQDQDQDRRPTTTKMTASMRFSDVLDFLIAWEGRATAKGLQYFWPVFDQKNKGYLTQVDVYQFFRATAEMLREAGSGGEVKEEDVKDEIFDMVKPVHPWHITPKDLLDSQKATLVIGLLSDMNSFVSYEMLESQMAMDESS